MHEFAQVSRVAHDHSWSGKIEKNSATPQSKYRFNLFGNSNRRPAGILRIPDGPANHQIIRTEGYGLRGCCDPSLILFCGNRPGRPYPRANGKKIFAESFLNLTGFMA